MHRKVTREGLIERLEEDYTRKRAAKERKIARRHFLCVLHKGVACEQALLFGQVKQVSRERASARRRPHARAV